MDYGDGIFTIGVGMSINFIRLAMGSPARMSYADSSGDFTLLQFFG